MIRRTGSGVRAGFVVAHLVSAVLLGAALRQADAQDVGDATAGQLLAERWCSSCHVLGPAPSSGTSNGAPTSAGIARMGSTTPLSLRAFFQTSHARMPDLHLSQDEIDDVAAYILSLRGK